MIKREIPNIITLFNLLCGVLAIVFLFESNNVIIPSLLILMGAFFDFFDGLAARLLKVESAIGRELDSLADVVTFGVAPALMTLVLLKGKAGFVDGQWSFLVFIPLFMALMSAYRLAKFNVDTRQTTSFLGVPTPANALLWLSLPVIQHLSFFKIHLWGWYDESFYQFLTSMLTNEWFIVMGSLIMSVMLVIEVPMMAFKFKNMTWKDNKVRFVFIVTSFLLFFVMNFYAIPFIIILYITVSIISNLITK